MFKRGVENSIPITSEIRPMPMVLLSSHTTTTTTIEKEVINEVKEKLDLKNGKRREDSQPILYSSYHSYRQNSSIRARADKNRRAF